VWSAAKNPSIIREEEDERGYFLEKERNLEISRPEGIGFQ
jgi:hypothetical protein